MLSFMIPTEEKGFNLNTPQNEVFQVSTSHSEVKPELNGSPNNNSHPVLTAGISSALDNAAGMAPPPLPSQPPPPLPDERPLLPHEVSLMEDSFSDDTVTESTLLLRPSDGPPTPPSTDTTRSSPAAEDKQPLLPSATPTTTVTGKTGKLKRVSFGSSKGSMVETVVYDYEPAQPLREEDGTESPTPRAGFTTSTPLSTPARPEPSAAERAASRVRVTYFESKKPLTVPAVEAGDTSTPEESDVSAPDALPQASPDVPAHTQVTASTGEMPTTYIVQTMDAGWENPFRPGGELSKEADQIVRAIQSGRPLDSSLDEADAAVTEPTDAAPAPVNGGPAVEPVVAATVQTAVAAAPPAARDGPSPAQTTTTAANSSTPAGHRNGGSAPAAQTAVAAQSPGTVEVQHTLVKPEDASQVEQVNLKKKPRGKCCVVQ
ncbi:proteoglycan 4-like [Amphibalanus amphitrite]|uniref:proteoglycan 4-like n=1 Tax=Amphibalanus amphitrite TaxID=1232801 RepID=UPI001C90936D|nr:proteoglycan 4-like [Amphibalanus amphitrite]